MHLLAEHLPLSLLWDLLDPNGPGSEDLLKHELCSVLGHETDLDWLHVPAEFGPAPHVVAER
jgi:hypothetical protein